MTARPLIRAARGARLGVCILALVAWTACSKPEDPSPQPAGMGSAAQTAPSTTGAAYDAKSDPLVNPPSLVEPAPADASQVASDETLVRNLDGNPGSLNPLFASSQPELNVTEMLFRGLFTFDAHFNWRLNDDIVASFEESLDHLTYTVGLKPGLTWQDGAPFTAEDVCYSWRVIMDPKVPIVAERTGTDQVVGCNALGPLVLELKNKEALPTNKWNVNFPLIPKHLYEKDQATHPDLNSGDLYDKLNRAPVGNGPYKLVEWQENDRIVLERWDGYRGTKPAFKRMVFRIIPDPNVLLLTFNKGDIDELRLSPQQFATQALRGSDFANAGGKKLLAPQWDFMYIGWNQSGSNPFFGDVRVRRAMTMSCDIKRMRRDLTYDLYDQCRGIYHPDSWMYPKEGVQLLPYDLKAAGKLLDEAGWAPDPQHEGWRYKTVDGTPVPFAFTMLLRQGSVLEQSIAGILQEDLKSIGVKMDTQVMERAAWQQRARKHEFQARMAAFGTGTDPDLGWNIWRTESFDPKGEVGRNYGGYSNKRVDELFEQGRHEFDQAKRAAIYGEIQRLIYEDQPYTFLFDRRNLWAIHRRIRGVQTGPHGVFGFNPGVLAWWVRQGEQRQGRSVH